jgi:transposase
MCPGFYGVGLLDFWSRHLSKEPCPCRSVIPRSFAAKYLISWPPGARSPRSLPDLGISDQTIYTWRKQELIDTGKLPGLSRSEQSELSAAKRRIRELENEVAILKRAHELLREPHDPKDDTRP